MLPVLLTAGAVLYASLTVAHRMLVEGDAGELLSRVAFGTALLCVSALLAVKRLKGKPSWMIHAIGLAVAATAFANPLVHLYLTGFARQTTNLGFLITCAGLAFKRRWQVYPLIVAGQVAWACIALSWGWNQYWTHHAFTLLMADVVAIVAFESRRKTYRVLFNHEERLMNEAQSDPLTGVWNRGGFRQYLRERFERKRAQGGQELAICFVDLDKFKLINDTYGHAAGDAVLQWVAQNIQATIREHDSVARLGGDEFVVVFERVASQLDAAAAAERIRAAVSDEFFWHEDSIDVRASVGVAWSGASPEGDEQLLAAADSAMYSDKRRRKLFEQLSDPVALPLDSD